MPHDRGYSGEFEERGDEPEERLVDLRHEDQKDQEDDAVRLELFEGTLGFRAQMGFQRVVAIQAGNWDQVQQ